jgi:mannose-6-phosphate isomerase
MGVLLRFTEIYKTRVWGGRRLETLLGRSLPDGQKYGESWELVDREEAQSVVVGGGRYSGLTLHELWCGYGGEVFGDGWDCASGGRFPLLIKVLDCADDLSLQVHPPAARALELVGEPKTEMWYVAEAEAGSKLYAGVKSGVTEESFQRALGNGTVAGCVHSLAVEVGDSLHVPSGRLHALGAGLMIYEIQQNSDTTYRVFDWDRLGLDGKRRELHVRESLLSIDFGDAEPELMRGGEMLSDCEHFRVRKSKTGAPRLVNGARLVMALSDLDWHGERVGRGCVALEPANGPRAEPLGEWLEIAQGNS